MVRVLSVKRYPEYVFPGMAMRYLAELDQRSVAPSVEAVAATAAFDEPLPERPGDPAETLDLLDRIGSPATMAMAGRRFFGFVIGGALPVSLQMMA